MDACMGDDSTSKSARIMIEYNKYKKDPPVEPGAVRHCPQQLRRDTGGVGRADAVPQTKRPGRYGYLVGKSRRRTASRLGRVYGGGRRFQGRGHFAHHSGGSRNNYLRRIHMLVAVCEDLQKDALLFVQRSLRW